jgi:hypothetical protein
MPAGRAEGKSELLSELIKQGVITEEQANNYRDRTPFRLINAETEFKTTIIKIRVRRHGFFLL